MHNKPKIIKTLAPPGRYACVEMVGIVDLETNQRMDEAHILSLLNQFDRQQKQAQDLMKNSKVLKFANKLLNKKK